MAQPARGQVAAIVTILCSLFTFAMLVGHSWLTLGVFGEGGIGPLGVEACTRAGECESAWWSQVPITGAIPVIAVAVIALGVSAFAFSATCGGLALAGRLQDMPHRTARVLLVIAVATSAIWLGLLATNAQLATLTSFEITSVGYGGVLSLAAMAVGFIGVQRLAMHAAAATRKVPFAPHFARNVRTVTPPPLRVAPQRSDMATWVPPPAAPRDQYQNPNR